MSAKKIEDKILFIQDSLLNHEQIKTAFSRYGTDFGLEFVSTGEAGLDFIKRHGVKAVFVPRSLPDMDGFKFLRDLKILKIQMPVIMIALDGDEKLALKALSEGAYDCITDGISHVESFPILLDRALARYEMNRENAETATLIIESKEEWTALFDGITDFIFMIDDEHRIVRTNRALAMTVDKHPREIIGRKCNELFGVNMVQAEYTETDGGQQHTEERTINDETYLVSSFPLYYDNRPLTIFVMKNITEMKRLKEQLYHADKLASIGLLTAGVAHEINNPLTGIIAYSQLLSMRITDERAKSELRKILDSAERCRKIVETLLTFSMQRIPSKSLESINDMIDRVLDLRSYYFKLNNIEIMKEYDKVPTVFVDSQQIQQVIHNLLLNAEQAIVSSGRGSGRITFVTRCHRENHKVIIKIADNGTGIPEDIISKIFDPFFTTKPIGVGTGMGLSTSHGIITEHGGSIKVERSGKKGTAFIIEIPTGIESGF